MLQRLGIRGKILAVVAVPIIVLLLATGFITLTAANALGDATNAQQLVASAQTSKAFQESFRAERDAGTNFLDSFTETRTARFDAAADITGSMGQLGGADPAAVTKVNAIFEGGQPTESGGTALSLEDARNVAPADVD